MSELSIMILAIAKPMEKSNKVLLGSYRKEYGLSRWLGLHTSLVMTSLTLETAFYWQESKFCN